MLEEEEESMKDWLSGRNDSNMQMIIFLLIRAYSRLPSPLFKDQWCSKWSPTDHYKLIFGLNMLIGGLFNRWSDKHVRRFLCAPLSSGQTDDRLVTDNLTWPLLSTLTSLSSHAATIIISLRSAVSSTYSYWQEHLEIFLCYLSSFPLSHKCLAGRTSQTCCAG